MKFLSHFGFGLGDVIEPLRGVRGRVVFNEMQEEIVPDAVPEDSPPTPEEGETTLETLESIPTFWETVEQKNEQLKQIVGDAFDRMKPGGDEGDKAQAIDQVLRTILMIVPTEEDPNGNGTFPNTEEFYKKLFRIYGEAKQVSAPEEQDELSLSAFGDGLPELGSIFNIPKEDERGKPQSVQLSNEIIQNAEKGSINDHLECDPNDSDLKEWINKQGFIFTVGKTEGSVRLFQKKDGKIEYLSSVPAGLKKIWAIRNGNGSIRGFATLDGQGHMASREIDDSGKALMRVTLLNNEDITRHNTSVIGDEAQMQNASFETDMEAIETHSEWGTILPTTETEAGESPTKVLRQSSVRRVWTNTKEDGIHDEDEVTELQTELDEIIANMKLPETLGKEIQTARDKIADTISPYSWSDLALEKIRAYSGEEKIREEAASTTSDVDDVVGNTEEEGATTETSESGDEAVTDEQPHGESTESDDGQKDSTSESADGDIESSGDELPPPFVVPDSRSERGNAEAPANPATPSEDTPETDQKAKAWENLRKLKEEHPEWVSKFDEENKSFGTYNGLWNKQLSDAIKMCLGGNEPGVEDLLEKMDEMDERDSIFQWINVTEGQIIGLSTQLAEIPSTFTGEGVKFLSAPMLISPVNLGKDGSFPNLVEVYLLLQESWVSIEGLEVGGDETITLDNRHEFEYVGGEIRKVEGEKEEGRGESDSTSPSSEGSGSDEPSHDASDSSEDDGTAEIEAMQSWKEELKAKMESMIPTHYRQLKYTTAAEEAVDNIFKKDSFPFDFKAFIKEIQEEAAKLVGFGQKRKMKEKIHEWFFNDPEIKNIYENVKNLIWKSKLDESLHESAPYHDERSEESETSPIREETTDFLFEGGEDEGIGQDPLDVTRYHDDEEESEHDGEPQNPQFRINLQEENPSAGLGQKVRNLFSRKKKN
ncbi:hypothetical protein K9L63_00650 [Candidatus Gracilibacteria bacterium]|nr:hypothetical protein [Candidatus Gracilibacteria bacterium]